MSAVAKVDIGGSIYVTRGDLIYCTICGGVVNNDPGRNIFYWRGAIKRHMKWHNIPLDPELFR